MIEDELLIEAFELEEETEYPETMQSLPQVADLIEDISADEDRETFIIDENENLISDENADTSNLIDGFPALLDPDSVPDPVIENNENNELLVEEGIIENKAEENIETRRNDNTVTVNDNINSNTLPDQTVNYDLKVDIPSYKEDLNEIREILYNIENETEENNVYTIDDLYYLIESKELDNERIDDIYYLLENNLNEEETELLEDKKDIDDLIEYLEKSKEEEIKTEPETEENYLKEIYDELGNIGKGFDDLKGEILQLENNQIIISKNDSLYSKIMIGGIFALLGAAGAVAFLGRLK